ncbi:hypothetical protein B0J14DRAFT_602846 [Halenospora varia]|nr:hypothetical protein B0J14DRAFT_611982 [Halenospora varia]KAH6667178.1 hypothetical protein B0J14DRAFT_602846 [Halenospora varia]
MTSSAHTDCLDLVQATKSGSKVQYLIKDLLKYFNVKAIAEKEGCSRVECTYDVSMILDSIREEFKKELVQSKKITDIIKAIVPRPEKKYYLSFVVRLLVFQSGRSDLGELIGKDDCIILIPVVVIGSDTATLVEQGAGRQTTFSFKVDSELVISGQCLVYMQPANKAVCVVLSIGKDKVKESGNDMGKEVGKDIVKESE